MADTKPAKCVSCGKDIQIGKFASLKTAYCEEHKSQAPKPAFMNKAAEKTPAPTVGEAVVAAADVFSAAAAVPVPGVATATPLTSPVPHEKETPAKAPEGKNQFSVGNEVKEIFLALIGGQVVKDPAKAEAAKFKISPHNILYYQFLDRRIVSFIEMGGGGVKKRCYGVAVSNGNETTGIFDQSQLYQMKPDEQAILLLYKKTFLA